MLLITGATGNLGKSVVAQLQTKLENDEFIVSSSTIYGVQNLKDQGLHARLADFDRVDTLLEAFEGIEKILLISTMALNRFEQHKNVIDTAKLKGVKHIVYTSLAIQNIATSKVKEIMESHFQTEEYLKTSGLSYTIVRNSMYAEAIPQIIGIELRSKIQLPGGNGAVPYALRSEMGEATANVVLQKGHENKVYSLGGSSAYSYFDIANALTDLTGDTFSYHDIAEEEYSAHLRKRGFVDFAVMLYVGTLKDVKQHQYEVPTDDLERLLGRPSTSLKEFLQEVFSLTPEVVYE